MPSSMKRQLVYLAVCICVMNFRSHHKNTHAELSFSGTLANLYEWHVVPHPIKHTERREKSKYVAFWNESSQVQNFQEAKVPGNESFQGTKVPRSESSTERKFH